MLKRQACLIGGEWVTGERWIEVDNPSTGEIVGRVPAFGAAETHTAIASADAALEPWAVRTAQDRADVLRRFHGLVMAQQDALAELLTLEQGKPLVEARGEIAYAASFLEWFAEEARRVYGEIVPSHAVDKRILVFKQPVGVVGAITPWNFPAAMVTRKIAPALAAGCTLVLKPAAQTPFTALALGELALQAGVPAGVFNIVTGDPVAIGAELTSSPIVRKITFTGSTATGARLFAQSAPTLKKLSLELGGNAPFIVFDDADLDKAVEGALQSKFRNAGQTCVCANRLYAQAGVYDAFVERLARAADALKVGDGRTPGVEIGPLIEDRALDKVAAHVVDALSKGAKVLAGGGRHALGGRFYAPTVLRDVTPEMAVTREETFGPLAAVSRFEDEAEVLRLANASELGLAAYVYTRDLGRVWRMSEGIEAGMVGVNTGLISTEVAPFGGVKASGLGREGSRHGIQDYLEIKYVCLGL